MLKLIKVGQTHVDENRLAAEINAKLKSDSNISYSEIANKAFEAGRKRLALNVRNLITFNLHNSF